MKSLFLLITTAYSLSLPETTNSIPEDGQNTPAAGSAASIDYAECSNCLESAYKKYCVENRQEDLAFYGNMIPPPPPIKTQCCDLNDRTTVGCDDS